MGQVEEKYIEFQARKILGTLQIKVLLLESSPFWNFILIY